MKTVKCPNCGNENLSTNIRCEKCNKQLITEDKIKAINLKPSHLNPGRIKSFEEILGGISAIIGGLVVIRISSMCLYKEADNITRIIGISLLIFSITILIYGISMIVKGINTKKNTDDYVNGKLDMEKVEKSEKDFKKVTNIVENIQIFVFALLWFGFLIVFDTVAIKSWADGGNSMFFFSLFFWAAGIYAIFTNIKKSK